MPSLAAFFAEQHSFCHASCCLHADSSSEITMQPQPTEKEIQFILDAIAEYLTVKASLNLLPSCLALKNFYNFSCVGPPGSSTREQCCDMCLSVLDTWL